MSRVSKFGTKTTDLAVVINGTERQILEKTGGRVVSEDETCRAPLNVAKDLRE